MAAYGPLEMAKKRDKDNSYYLVYQAMKEIRLCLAGREENMVIL